MKVLMITGDKNFAASERFALQASQVEKLSVLFMGRGALWPKIPAGTYDVVTSQDPLLRGVFARRAANKAKARLNVQVHLDLEALPFWKRVLAGYNLQQADTVRVVSEKIKQQVLRMAPHTKVSVLPIYVDIDRFKAVVAEPHSQKTILWIGRFELEKDPLFAVHMLKEVLDANVDAKLIMLGAGSLEVSIKTVSRGLAPLSGISVPLPIEFEGWKDPALYLSQADVVVCTSLHESWGASMVEALAAGVPVVAPDVGIAKEAGAIVAVRSDLAKKVIDVLKTNQKAELKLKLLSEEEWAKAWRNTLVG